MDEKESPGDPLFAEALWEVSGMELHRVKAVSLTNRLAVLLLSTADREAGHDENPPGNGCAQKREAGVRERIRCWRGLRHALICHLDAGHSCSVLVSRRASLCLGATRDEREQNQHKAEERCKRTCE